MEKLTCFNVTTAAQIMKGRIISTFGITDKAFHRRMLDYYFSLEPHLDERLLITEKSNPDRIIKEQREQIHLTDVDRQKIEEWKYILSKRYNKKVTSTMIMFQAMIDYLTVTYPLLDE